MGDATVRNPSTAAIGATSNGVGDMASRAAILAAARLLRAVRMEANG